jgi:predicted RNase H-like HicB family nuclease
MIYQAVFERADDGSVWAYVPDLPGCTSFGATIDEAQTNVAEAARLWIEDAHAKGEALPASTTIAALAIEVEPAA